MHIPSLKSLRKILLVGLGVIILVWLAGCGLIYSKMRKSPEDQNKEHQFGVSGAHSLKSTFRGNCRKSGIRFIHCRIRVAGKTTAILSESVLA
jgi:hypothetical protein